jgi:hypothetical protein
MRWRRATVVGLSCGSALLGGCSGIPQLTPVASYTAANVFSPAGYGQTKLGDDHYQVQGTGTEATPKERVEKIARARAAQIGVDEKFNYFKVTSVQHGVACSERQKVYKGEGTAASSRPTVVLDVVYAKETADPTFANTKERYEALSAELAGEVVAPDVKAVTIQETRASCGQG